jgi:hypothetical protein
VTDDRAVTRQELADLLGCSKSYVNKLRAHARVVMAADGKHYLLEATRRRIAETRDPSKRPVAERHAAARGAALALPGAAGPGDGAAPVPNAAPAGADAADEALMRVDANFANAKARREHAEASLKELDLRKRQGELLERSDVLSAFDRAMVTLFARLEALADTIGPQVVGMTDEARARTLVAEIVLLARREVVRDFGAGLEVAP